MPLEAVFRDVKKIGWSRHGVEVEIVRRYRQRFNGNGRGIVRLKLRNMQLQR